MFGAYRERDWGEALLENMYMREKIYLSVLLRLLSIPSTLEF
jgi:hypothetical protein